MVERVKVEEGLKLAALTTETPSTFALEVSAPLVECAVKMEVFDSSQSSANGPIVTGFTCLWVYRLPKREGLDLETVVGRELFSPCTPSVPPLDKVLVCPGRVGRILPMEGHLTWS